MTLQEERIAAISLVMIEETLQHCWELTGGAAFPEAVEAIGIAVQRFVRRVQFAAASVQPNKGQRSPQPP